MKHNTTSKNTSNQATTPPHPHPLYRADPVAFIYSADDAHHNPQSPPTPFVMNLVLFHHFMLISNFKPKAILITVIQRRPGLLL